MPSSPEELMNAFALFTKASESLEGVHGHLLQQIEYLSQELETSNARLRQSLWETEAMRNELLHIIESQPNGVMVLEPSGLILHSNHRIKEFFHVPIERTIYKLEDMHLQESCREYLQSCLNQPAEESVRVLTLGETEAKEKRHLALSTSPLRDTSGHIAGIIVVVHDNTQLKRLEEENHQREKLAAMGSMAAQLAHEIRNPLSSIGLFASLINDSLDEAAPAHKWCRQIDAAVNTMNTLVSNMLHLAKPQAMSLQPLDLHRVLDGVSDFALPLLETHNIVLERNWSAGESLVNGNEEALRQMTLNLLLNAVQAMPDGGRLRLETRPDEGPEDDRSICLHVIDTGTGVDPDLLPRLFEPGFSQRQGGTGLGLWIVGQIIEKHAARVQIRSEVGKGTEFQVDFPLCKQENEGSFPGGKSCPPLTQ